MKSSKALLQNQLGQGTSDTANDESFDLKPPRQELFQQLRKLSLYNDPQSAFNNFYTPNNDFFYSKSPYQSLSLTRREIRLLRVFPRKPFSEHARDNPQWSNILDNATLTHLSKSYRDFGITDPNAPLLAFELVDKASLSKVSGTYCAISYCAGKVSDTAVVVVDGLPFMAFANLEHAIDNALKYWEQSHPGKQLYLWADQICINQQDHEERAGQVALMRDIYRRSDESFICLSTPGMVDVLEWVRDLEPNNLGAPDSLESRIKTWADGQLSFHADPPVDSFKAFTECPWWQRSWVFQEFVASPRPIFLSYETAVPWKELDNVLALLSSDKFKEIIKTKVHRTMAQLQEEKAMEAQYAEAMESWTLRKEATRQKLLQTYKRAAEENQKYQANIKGLRDKQNTAWWDYIRGLHDAFARMDDPPIRRQGSTAPLRARTTMIFVGREDEPRHLRILQILMASDYSDYLGEAGNSNAKVQQPSCGCVYQSSTNKDMASVYLDPPTSGCGCSGNSWRSCLYIKRVAELFPSEVKWPTRPDMIQVKVLRHSVYIDIQEYDSFHSRNQEKPHLPFQHWKCCLLQELENQFKWSVPSMPPKRSGLALEQRINGLKKWDSTFKRGLDCHQRIFSMMEIKRRRKRWADLKPLLEHSRHCEASDPRDRIYAFIGLVPGACGIAPDYHWSNTIVHVLLDAAQKIAQHDGNLNLLRHSFRGREALGSFLPSWVPDWTSRAQADPVRTYLAHLGGDKDLEAPSEELPKDLLEFRKHDDNETNIDLKAAGYLVDILDLDDGPVPEFPTLQMWSLVEADGLQAVTLKTALADDEIWALDGASLLVLLRPEGGDEYSFRGEVLLNGNDGHEANTMTKRGVDAMRRSNQQRKNIWII